MLVKFIEAIGGATIRSTESVGDFVCFGASAIRQGCRPPWHIRRWTEQMVSIGVRSFPVALLTSLFVGMVMVLQTGYQLAAFNAKLYSAGINAIALAREMIPVFVAMVVGARVSAAIAAELGTMNVTEQIDAMEVLGVDPKKYLVVPRVIASTIMLPILGAYCMAVGIIGGLIVGVVGLGIGFEQYLSTTFKFLTLPDVYSGLAKTVVFGFLIGSVGCYCGFRVRGGAKGVGEGTTRAVVLTMVSILIADYFLTTWILYFAGLF
jgi:phospholipid/cholesterol/gamma-HCH transport system permease protein